MQVFVGDGGLAYFADGTESREEQQAVEGVAAAVAPIAPGAVTTAKRRGHVDAYVIVDI